MAVVVGRESFLQGAANPYADAYHELAGKVLCAVQDMFGVEGPPGAVGIVCSVAEKNCPYTVWPTRDGVYEVKVCNPTTYEPFVFELGHELGHVMMGPGRTNGSVEALATAVSLECLVAIGFSDYARKTIRAELGTIGARLVDAYERNNLDLLREHRIKNQVEVNADAGHRRNALRILGAACVLSKPTSWRDFLGFAHGLYPPLLEEPAYRSGALLRLSATTQGQRTVLERITRYRSLDEKETRMVRKTVSIEEIRNASDLYRGRLARVSLKPKATTSSEKGAPTNVSSDSHEGDLELMMGALRVGENLVMDSEVPEVELLD